MKQVLVVYQADNGYKCGCCNQEWEETEVHELRSNANVQNFLKKEQESIEKWYNRAPFSGGAYGRFKILKAFIISEEIEFETDEE